MESKHMPINPRFGY